MRILRDLIASMQDGLIPSGDGPEAPDTTLWFFEAARLVADALGDSHSFVTDELLLALRDAFDAALRGTRHGIHITEDGLFAVGFAGEPNEAPPWLAARCQGPATVLCLVELSALWARGCDTLARLARAAGDLDLSERATAQRARTRAAFAARFWCEETGYPYDMISTAVGGEGVLRDASVRPNAVIALAVDRPCFTEERAAQTLDRARQELLTRAGLRTLAPSDPRYIGHRDGGATHLGGASALGPPSNGALLKGTVFPWLLGFFIRAARQSGDEREHITPLLERLLASAAANEAALGHLPEIADGDLPHAPGGCVAHALCVAELLRAAAWDLTP